MTGFGFSGPAGRNRSVRKALSAQITLTALALLVGATALRASWLSDALSRVGDEPEAAFGVSSCGSIVFVRQGNLWVVDADGAQERQLTKDGGFARPSASPDGKRVVCERHVKVGQTRSGATQWSHAVWVVDIAGSVRARRLLSLPDTENMYPSFSSDGRYVICAKRNIISRAESGHSVWYCRDALVAVEVSTLKVRLLHDDGLSLDAWEPSFVSPCSLDGIRDIVYTYIPHEGGDDEPVMRLQSGKLTEWIKERTRKGNECGGSLYDECCVSPDRKLVAAVRFYHKSGHQLCLIEVQNRSRRVVCPLPDGAASGAAPSWSPDGCCVVLGIAPGDATTRGNSVYDWYCPPATSGDLWVVDLTTGKKRKFLRGAMQPTWCAMRIPMAVDAIRPTR